MTTLPISILRVFPDGSSLNESSPVESPVEVLTLEGASDITTRLKAALEEGFKRERFPIVDTGRFVVYAGNPNQCYMRIFDVTEVPNPRFTVELVSDVVDDAPKDRPKIPTKTEKFGLK